MGHFFTKIGTNRTMKRFDARKITMLGMLTAVSFLLVLVGKLVPNVAGFLSYDPKDAMVVMSGFILNPVAALIISVLVSLIEMLTISTTGIYGFLMNVISTCSFALPAAIIYRRHRTIKGAVIGLGIGVLFMSGCMVLWNYLITPLYMKVPREVVAGMLASVFLPFNLVKGGLNMGLSLLLYKPLITALRKVGLLPKTEHKANTKGKQALFTLTVLLFLAVCVVLFLLVAKVIG